MTLVAPRMLNSIHDVPTCLKSLTYMCQWLCSNMTHYLLDQLKHVNRLNTDKKIGCFYICMAQYIDFLAITVYVPAQWQCTWCKLTVLDSGLFCGCPGWLLPPAMVLRRVPPEVDTPLFFTPGAVIATRPVLVTSIDPDPGIWPWPPGWININGFGHF